MGPDRAITDYSHLQVDRSAEVDAWAAMIPVLLGQAVSNHWSAWAVDESEVRFGVVPVVSTICHALTVGLVQPLLKSAGVTDADLYQVWYDETVLQVRPDRSKDAQALYDKHAISREVLRRENGFADADAPDDAEHTATILLDLAQRAGLH